MPKHPHALARLNMKMNSMTNKDWSMSQEISRSNHVPKTHRRESWLTHQCQLQPDLSQRLSLPNISSLLKNTSR